MQSYQQAFIQFALKKEALLFGSFTLKSGRKSPYFFNTGQFKTGQDMAKLGQFYAAALRHHFQDQPIDLLFGAAYKGIPLVVATAIALAQTHQKVLPFCFNRKERKDHGDGGIMVGETMAGRRILLIDDVVTAGTTLKEAANVVAQQKGQLIGALIALDRQEQGEVPCTAIQEAAKAGISVASIVTLTDLITYLKKTSDDLQNTHLKKHLPAMLAYSARYGVLQS